MSHFLIRGNSQVFFLVVAFCLVVGDALSCFAQQDLPFDVFGEAIDNHQIYLHLEKNAVALVDEQPVDAVKKLQEQLKQVDVSSEIKLDSLICFRPSKKEELYQHMVKSSLYLGELYNCGRCDRTHAGFSGGVVISEDGLALTNYHVLEERDNGRTEGFMAMTYDGRCFGIEEVLAANESADIALVRLKADGYKFHAAPIATTRPDPMDTVRIVSNPAGEFFVLTQGEVSRYARMQKRRGEPSNDGAWMEVTADFGGGSSGSGVFNARGEVVGVVSSIRPLMRGAKKASDGDEAKGSESKKSQKGFVEMVLRKCVPLRAVHGCFKGTQ